MPSRMNFTAASLAKVQVPEGADRVYVYDARTPALAYCVTSTGHRSFYLYRRVDGRPQRIRIGGHPELTIEQARDKAAEYNGDIARGIDPLEQRRQARAVATVGELFTHYLDAH